MAEQIVRGFDCAEKIHVEWLKELGDGMAKVTGGAKCDVVAIMNRNPVGEKLDNPQGFAYVHFQLCMKYANAVLNKAAYIPK